jgi:REP element-mobilizing transposase RayT
MARPLRIEFEGTYYHVTARGNERRKIFFMQRDFEKFKGYTSEGDRQNAPVKAGMEREV